LRVCKLADNIGRRRCRFAIGTEIVALRRDPHRRVHRRRHVHARSDVSGACRKPDLEAGNHRRRGRFRRLSRLRVGAPLEPRLRRSASPRARTGSGSDPFRSLASHGMLMATIQFSNLRVRAVTPKARFAPILPITETGCNTVVRLDPPMRAFAPTPGPREISPLTPT
jgi:hypothetical protein